VIRPEKGKKPSWRIDVKVLIDCGADKPGPVGKDGGWGKDKTLTLTRKEGLSLVRRGVATKLTGGSLKNEIGSHDTWQA